MKGKILIIFFVALFCLSSIPYLTNTVLALPTTYPIGFEGEVAGTNYTGSVLKTHYWTSPTTGSPSTFLISNSNYHTGNRCMKIIRNNGGFYIWLNLTVGGGYLTNFSFESKFSILSAFASGEGHQMVLYNATMGMGYDIINLSFFNDGTPHVGYKYKNDIGNWVSVSYGSDDFDRYTYHYVNIFNDLGDVKYGSNYSNVVGTARRPTMIADGYLIDRIYFSGSLNTLGTWMAIDDMNFTLSGSYSGITPPPPSSGCYDENTLSNYDVLDHVQESATWLRIYVPYIEFIGQTTITGILKCFNLNVYTPYTSNYLTEYTLYINNNLMGNPSCVFDASYQTKTLQWDLSGINLTLTNEKPVFELYRTTANSVKWGLQTHHSRLEGKEHFTYQDQFIYSFFTNHINGFVDGNVTGYPPNDQDSPQWKLYYDTGSLIETPCGYDNNINLVDNNGIALKNSNVWDIQTTNTYTTIYFDTFVNTTSNLYLWVDKLDSITGTPVAGQSAGVPQGFPYLIKECHSQFSFTPTEFGNYSVYLIPDTVGFSWYDRYGNIEFNITDNPYESYKPFIYTSPNPSREDQSIRVFVHSTPILPYSQIMVGGSILLSNINDLDNTQTQLWLQSFTTGDWVGDTPLPTNNGIVYFRLFGRNFTGGSGWHPLSDIYTHHTYTIRRGNYIDCSLKATNYNGFIDTSFTIYGYYSSIFNTGSVYKTDTSHWLFNTGKGDFTYTTSENIAGSYTYYLMENINGKLTQVDKITIHIKLKPVTPPSGGGIDTLLPPPFSYIAGAIITLMFVIAPVIFIGKVGIDNSIMKYVPVFTGMVGFILSCLVGFFPWYAIFGLVLILVLVIVVMWQNNKA